MSIEKIHGNEIEVETSEARSLIYHWKEHSSETFNRILHDVRHSTNISSTGKKQIYVGEGEDFKLQYDGKQYFLKRRKR